MYPYTSIQLNHREVAVDAILKQEVQPENNVEQSALAFIKDWLSETPSFSFQTSGTTGTPKPFTFTRHQLQQSAARTINALGLQPGDNALVCLNTHYIAGKMMLARAMEHQLRLTVVDPTSNPFEQLPPGYQPDFMAVVPMQLQTLVHDPENHSRLNNMKAVLVGGAPVSLALRNELQKLSCPVYETYGMTETLSNVALRLINTTSKTDHFIPLAGVSINIDHRGCLVIHDSIQSEPLVTNDLGEVDANGNFIWLGRFDNVINTGGIKVYPEKIELVLEQHLGKFTPTFNYFIGPTPDDRFGQVVTLFVDKNALSQTNLDRIIAKVNTLPSGPEKPKRIALINIWRLTETGKTDRKQIISCLSEEQNQLVTLS
ncbi:MAG: AMP-binding protein [Cyclobacteriaceae bacterium]|nr:AMP-binding protein [Cyclobacteriaceae bacterium]